MFLLNYASSEINREGIKYIEHNTLNVAKASEAMSNVDISTYLKKS